MPEHSQTWPPCEPGSALEPSQWPFVCIGPGRVGSTLSRALIALGFPPVGIGGIPTAEVERLADELGTVVRGVAGQGTAGRSATAGETPAQDTDWSGLGRTARLIVLTVPDDVLGEVSTRVLNTAGLGPGNCVLQTSATIAARPAVEHVPDEPLFVSLHPMKPIPAPDLEPAHFHGVVFGVEGNEPARELGCALAHLLGGHPIELAAADKPAYHAAGVLAYTGLMALYGAVSDLARIVDLPGQWLQQGIVPGLVDTLEQLQGTGLPAALTGPVSRGDCGVILAHLEALETRVPHLLPLYREITRFNIGVAEAGGKVDCDTICALRDLLETF